MEKIILFKCSFCGEKFPEEFLCTAHEKEHEAEVEIIGKFYSQRSESNRWLSCIPNEIMVSVKTSNGYCNTFKYSFLGIGKVKP